MSVRNECQNELEKLKRMSFQDKLWYLWSYYKVYLAVFIAIVAVLGVAATALYDQTFTTRLGLALVNNHSPNAQNAVLLEERLRSLLDCGKKDVVEISSGLYLGEAANAEDSYLAQTKLTALIASDALDIIIADQETIDLYAAGDMLCDLSQTLPGDLTGSLEDRFCLSPAPSGDFDSDENPRLSGESLPYSISLEGTWLTNEGYVSMDAPCLAVISGSPRTEAAVQVIRSLFP